MKTKLLIILILATFQFSTAQEIKFEKIFPLASVSKYKADFDGACGQVAFIDIDNDNDKDVLLTGNNNFKSNAKFYKNDGKGNFSELTEIPFLGIHVITFAFADVDNDSDKDILIEGKDNDENEITKLYKNDGNGNFTMVVGTPFFNAKQGSISFADVDNDNDQDVLITGRSSSNIIVAKLYKNDGSGNFTEDTTVPFTGVYRSSSAFADVDNDNDLDVVISGRSGVNVYITKVYKNDGSGNFTEVTSNNFEELYNTFISFNDFDNDNDKDLLITGQNNYDKPKTKLYKNDGNGNFIETASFKGVCYAFTAFEDIDNDNDEDLLIAGFDSKGNEITVLYKNDGNGNFTEILNEILFNMIKSKSFAFADVDNDNDKDLLIAGTNNFGHLITKLYINDGSGKFARVKSSSFCGVAYNSLDCCDIDNDNDQDLIITGYNGYEPQVAIIYKNDGNGNFHEVKDTPFIGGCCTTVEFADIDNDNDMDVLVVNEKASKLYKNDGNGNFTEIASSITEVGIGSVKFSDIDNDNDKDLLITGSKDGKGIAKLYKNDGNGNYIEDLTTAFEGVFYSSVAFADIDNDNDTDVLIAGKNNNEQNITQLYKNDGAGNFTIATVFDGIYSGSVAFADMDNDGYIDLLLTGNGIAKLYKNDGTGNFNEVANLGTAFHSSISIADVNNDNKQDILITHGKTTNYCFANIYKNNGNFNFTEVKNLPFRGVLAGVALFVDIDNDNAQDVLISGISADGPITELFRNTSFYGTTETIIKKIKFYPNPTTSIVNLELFENAQDIQIKVRDILGKLTKQQHFKNKKKISFEIEGSEGIYFVEIILADKKEVIKVVKK